MKKIVLFVAFIIVVLVSFVKFDIIIAVLGTEKIGDYELGVLNKTRTIKDEQYAYFEAMEGLGEKVPLPRGAVLFRNDIYPSENQYMIPSDSWNEYKDEMIKKGFDYDRMGATHFFAQKNGNARITMNVEPFSAYFNRIIVYVVL